ncbi:hypothetical protein C8N33_108161 [Pararhodobacter aggregans]|nr:hypothetical protein C8N33_108161 [Pararhodobacter aggregans]
MIPPRHLVRRLLALAVDSLLAWALVVVLLLSFTERGLRLPVPVIAIRGYDCTEVEQAPDWLEQALGQIGAYSLRHCATTLFGLPNGHELRVILSDTRQGALRTSRRFVVPVDAALRVVPARPWIDLLPLALLGLASALFTAFGWSTPGKRLLGLRLQPVGTPRPIRREILRLGPLLILGSAPLWPGLGAIVTWGPGAVLAAMAAIALALTWYYLWPFAHWTGQSRHDRLSGTRVIAAKAAPVPPPAGP